VGTIGSGLGTPPVDSAWRLGSAAQGGGDAVERLAPGPNSPTTAATARSRLSFAGAASTIPCYGTLPATYMLEASGAGGPRPEPPRSRLRLARGDWPRKGTGGQPGVSSASCPLELTVRARYACAIGTGLISRTAPARPRPPGQLALGLVAKMETSGSIGAMEAVELGSRIARLREARGLTGSQFGARLGLTKSQVSKVESGARRVDVSELAVMADLLGVSLGELLGSRRSASLALAARVMSLPTEDSDVTARRRLRQVLEAESVLEASAGLGAAGISAAGEAVLKRVGDERLARSGASSRRSGERLAAMVREELGLGRAPIADLVELAERHFGVDVALWPTGEGVSGLCAHLGELAVFVVNTEFPSGHVRFTTAHELAHHLLGDPREVVVERGDLYAISTPPEARANAFAAALLMPEEGLRELIGPRPLSAEVLGELLLHFQVSKSALINRLNTLGVLSQERADHWQRASATSILRAAGDSNPDQRTRSSHERRIPTRLWRNALESYRAGRVGVGVLGGLADVEADDLYSQLAADGILPPPVIDDLADI